MKKKANRTNQYKTSTAAINRKGRKSKSTVKKSSLNKKTPVRSGKGTRRVTARRKPRTTKQKNMIGKRSKSTARLSTVRRLGTGRSQKMKLSSISRARSKRRSSARASAKKKIIRVLEHGQYLVNSQTLRKLNAIDNSIVRRLERGNITDEEFKTKIEQLEEIVTKNGKPLDPKTIASSDIILPDNSLTMEEASKIFHGEGIIPGLD